MIAKRRKHHWLIALLVFGVTVWPGIDARGAGAGDPELEVTAQGLAEQIATLRTEKDSSAMAEALQTFVRVHNELESKTLRHDLQHAVGKVLKDKKMGAARELAAEALGACATEAELHSSGQFSLGVSASRSRIGHGAVLPPVQA